MNARMVKIGVVSGLAGGLIFGVMMSAMGMLPMVAMLVGSETAFVGFIVHMVNSAIIGGLFGLLLGTKLNTMVSSAKLGLFYGAFWWVLGPLLIMPVALGMGPQLSLAGAQGSIPSLVGHLVYGLILGASYFALIGPMPSPEEVPAEDNEDDE